MTIDGVTPRDRQARLATYAAFGVQGLCFATLVTQVPQIQKAHHLSDATLSLVLLAVPLLAGVGSVLTEFLFKRLGSAIVLRVAQPLECLAILLVGLTGENNAALFVTVGLFGLLVGAVDASMNAQAVAVERRYGVSLITGFYAVWSVAGIAGGLWASLSNRLDLSLAVAFGIVTAVGAAVAIPVERRLMAKAEEAAGQPSPEELKAAGRTVPWRPILLVGAAMAAFYLADAALSSYGAKYLDDELGSADWVAPLGYVAYQIAMTISRGGADLLVRRRGAPWVVRVGGAIGLAGMIGVVAAPNTAVAIPAFALVGLGLSVVAPISYTAAARVDPTGLGVAVARVNIFNYVGFVLGAAVVGAIAPMDEENGLRLAFVVPTVLVLVILAVAKSFDPRPVPGSRPDTPVAERPTV